MKNYISRTPMFVLTLLLVLLLMGFLPSFTILGGETRPVDLISDIRPDAKSEIEEQLPPLPAFPLENKKEQLLVKESIPKGVTPIIDYADSTQRGMFPYYEKLDQLETLNRPLHIAFLGDSFVEGDIFSGDLRSLLQSKYGGCGVGWVGITSPTYGFRKTVKHRFKGFRSHFSTDTTGFSYRKSTLSCAYFYALGDAYLKLQGETSYGQHLDTCERATLYYTAPSSETVYTNINNERIQHHYLMPETRMKKLTIEGKIGKVQWRMKDSVLVRYYGAALDGRKGIALDNYALRGSAGYNYGYLGLPMLRQLNKLRTYDLIIVAYGLNVATADRMNYESYQKRMIKVISHLKKAFPQAGFLLLSVGDRDYKNKKGDMVTMKGVKSLIRYQQLIASESHIAFWNMQEAMGGDGSMVKFVKAKPTMANYDYTHINHLGGAHMANLLFKAMMYGKEKHNRQNKAKDDTIYVEK